MGVDKDACASDRVLADRMPRAEPYSINETFLDLTGLPGNLHERCQQLRADDKPDTARTG